MPAPKIDPFQDGEALNLTDDVVAQETAETQQAADATAEPVTAEPQQAAEGQQPPAKELGPVPYPRFKEVNEAKTAAERRAADLERERNELRERWARLDERKALLTEASQSAAQQAAVQAQAAQRPDPTIDPTGAELFDLKQSLAQERQAREAMAAQFQQVTGSVQQTQQQQDFNNWVQFQAQSYAQQDPQYFDKAARAATWRTNFWTKLGMTPEKAQERVMHESMLIAAEARANGVNFAPFIAELADVLEIMAQRQNGQAQNGNGQRAGQTQRLQQVQAGQRVQGIGHLPGSGGENQGSYRQYSAAQIAQMSEAEWSRAMANPKTKADLQYAMALAEGIEPNEMGRI